MTQENETILFHNESAITRIALWANIVAYTILVFALIGFLNQAYSIISTWSEVVARLPPGVFDRIALFVTQVFMEPLVGVFYFLVLRGLSQLLNLGLDLLYSQGEDAEPAAPQD